MKSVLERGALTQYLLDYLRAEGFTVGIAEQPGDGGWTGEPGASGSVYRPFLVLTPLTASPPTGAVSDSSTEWMVPYSLSTAGVTALQVEDVADAARKSMAALQKQSVRLGATSWRILQSENPSIGGVTADKTLDPTTFIQTDTISLRISKDTL